MATLAPTAPVRRETEWSVAVAGAALVVFLSAAPFVLYPVFVMKALCFALFACAFNLLIGYVGLVSFGHALYFGWASYLAAYSAKVWGLPPELAVLCGIATALVLGLIAGIMFVLLFLLTGSVVMPLKALVLNVLSLTAAFGAMVWIFQDGHLGAFGTTPSGILVANIPVLLFCIAFGLSMDYEVFLVSRIREFWLASGAADNDESVARGIARTGRVVTAAALIMSISFAALIASNVSFMRMFGFGLTLAILGDATFVRMLLVPAFMRVMGEFNWWAPKPLARLHDRFPITSEFTTPSAPAEGLSYSSGG